MGLVGLDPGTFGSKVECSEPVVLVRLTWSQSPTCSHTFAEVSSRLLLRLQNWLYELDVEEFGDIRIRDSDSFTW